MNDWKERLAAEIRRDWRRTGVLVLLTIVAIVLVIREFSGQPDQAHAGGAKESDSSADRAPAHPGETAVANGPGQSGGQTGKVFTFSVDSGAVPPMPRRDPFVVDLERFPPDPAAKPSGNRDANLKVNARDSALAEIQRRQAAEAAIRAEAAKLQLQSILMADPPRVMIGRDIYRVGQRVGSFVLTRITSNSVVLEKGGFEVTLRME